MQTTPQTNHAHDSRAMQARLAQDHAAKHGLDFVAAFKQLGFDYLAAQNFSAPDRATATTSDRAEKARRAEAHAAQHGVDFVTAFKQLGFDAEAPRPAHVPSAVAPVAPVAPVTAAPAAGVLLNFTQAQEHPASPKGGPALLGERITAHAISKRMSFVQAARELGFNQFPDNPPNSDATSAHAAAHASAWAAKHRVDLPLARLILGYSS